MLEQATLWNMKRGGAMDWLAVTNEVHAQIADCGEAFIPWSVVEQSSSAISKSPESLQLAKSSGVDLSPMAMLKLLAEKEGHLEFAIDPATDFVHLKKPVVDSPVAQSDALTV